MNIGRKIPHLKNGIATRVIFYHVRFLIVELVWLNKQNSNM